MTNGVDAEQFAEIPAIRIIHCPERDKPWVLATAILGSSLAFIEGTVVNLALPAIQSDLGANSVELQWVINVYMLVLGAFMLIGGALGDRFGLRRIFIFGTTLFGVGALACGFAPSLSWLIVARIVQGLGGALLVPNSLALIGSHFDDHERGRAIGTWAGASALTTALGPVLGGAVIDAFGWEAVFIMIVPFAAATVLLASWRVPVSPPGNRNRLDTLGAVLLVASLSLFIHGLVTMESPILRWGEFIGAVILAVIFIRHEKKSAQPMLPLSLFRSRPFVGANLITLLLYFALSGALYFLPFNLIQVQGYTALQAGAAFLPFALILGFGSTFAGDLLRRLSTRMLLSVGPLLAAIGFALLAISGEHADYVSGFLPGIVLSGIGMTLSVAPLTTVVMSSVSQKQAGIASGVNNTASRIAGVLAVAALTALAVHSFTGNLQDSLSADIPSQAAAELLQHADRLAELAAPAGVTDTQAAGIRASIAKSYVATFRLLVLVCALLAVLSSLIAWVSLKESITVPADSPENRK